MPRHRVTTTYTKAKRTPSARRRETIHPSFIPELKQPKGLSPLAQYVEDNRDTGIPVSELIEQFQDYDCEHEIEEEAGRSTTRISYSCLDCGRVRFQDKPGVK